VVCRCECVDAGTIRHSAATSWNDLQNVKATTRAGMGPCQSRECGHTVAALVAAGTGTKPQRFSVRMPIKPIPIRGLSD
jgi:NAD(P)H-nitrite reductase large subunit